MEFIYDPKKSKANLKKHGVDFEQVKALWSDSGAVIVTAKTVGESRLAIIGQINGKVWIAIFTVRGKKTRIISARRAQPKEERIYNG